jgi:diacylglycerol kinase (ATP)
VDPPGSNPQGIRVGIDQSWLMIAFLHSRARSFRNAFNGWWYVIRTQKNAWIHILATVCVVVLASWLKLELHDWAILVLTIALVWTAEFINTALEAVVDLASPHHHPLAKVGKDVGAAAVLIASGSAVIIGILILGPPLWGKLITIAK